MHAVRSYRIEIAGQVEEAAFNATSPVDLRVEQQDSRLARATVCADQAAVVGLIRHLHQHGFIFLSIARVDDAVEPKCARK